MKGKRKASISIVLLAGLIVLMGGAAVVAMTVNGKYNLDQNYRRIANRYIAESGIDLALGLLENYLGNQTFVMSYTVNNDGSFSIMDEFSPYLLEDIRLAAEMGVETESIPLQLINVETNDYLSAIGFRSFRQSLNGLGGVDIKVNTFFDNSYFKLSRMCITPEFFLQAGAAVGVINPIYVTCSSSYLGGNVMCNAVLNGIKLVRPAFDTVLAPGEHGSVEVQLDTSDMDIRIDNYQNYI